MKKTKYLLENDVWEERLIRKMWLSKGKPKFVPKLEWKIAISNLLVKLVNENVGDYRNKDEWTFFKSQLAMVSELRCLLGQLKRTALQSAVSACVATLLAGYVVRRKGHNRGERTKSPLDKIPRTKSPLYGRAFLSMIKIRCNSFLT